MIKILILITILYIIHNSTENFESISTDFGIDYRPRYNNHTHLPHTHLPYSHTGHTHIPHTHYGHTHSEFPDNIYLHTDWIKNGVEGYGNFNPSDALPEIVREFGPPDIFDPSVGGTAIWKNSTLRTRGKGIYQRIEIRDENIPHAVPIPHTNYLYGTAYINVPTTLIPKVLGISDCISYDPLKKTVTAKNHHMGGITATLALACMVARNELTLEEIQHRELYKESVLATDKRSNTFDPEATHKFEKILATCVRAHDTNNISRTSGDAFLIPKENNKQYLPITTTKEKTEEES
jgi:hypothetical protein